MTGLRYHWGALQGEKTLLWPPAKLPVNSMDAGLQSNWTKCPKHELFLCVFPDWLNDLYVPVVMYKKITFPLKTDSTYFGQYYNFIYSYFLTNYANKLKQSIMSWTNVSHNTRNFYLVPWNSRRFKTGPSDVFEKVWLLIQGAFSVYTPSL